MPRCEDYPCCGHEAGACPDASGRFPCATCGRRMPRTAPSAICAACRRRDERRARLDPEGYDLGDYETGGGW